MQHCNLSSFASISLTATIARRHSYYIANEYADKFSKMGLFTPTLDAGTLDAGEYYHRKFPPADMRIYLMTGTNDGDAERMLSQLLHSELIKNGHNVADIYWQAHVGTPQREALWRSQFKDAVLWMFNKVVPPLPAK